jgi:NADPH oxidase 5
MKPKSEPGPGNVPSPGRYGSLPPVSGQTRMPTHSHIAPKGKTAAEDVAPSVFVIESEAPLSGGPPSTRGPLHPLDAALLDTLEKAFVLHAGQDEKLDAGELQKAMGYRNPLLAERLLQVFDRDGDGIVTRAEFLDRVRRLLYGTCDDKLRFAFHIHDLDGDGFLEHGELLAMVRAGMVEERTLDGPQTPDELADLVLSEADQNSDGLLSYREFAEAVWKYPDVLDMITRCEAHWIAPNADLLASRPLGRTWSHRLGRLFANKVPSIAFLALWFGVQAWLAARAFSVYRAENGFYITARMAGACLNFNGALILLPVMRRLLTEIRQSAWRRIVPVDDALTFHRLVGHTMFGLGLVHAAGHLGNYQASTLGVANGVFGTSAGFSGYLLLLVAAWMWVTAWPVIRRTSHFELFYFSHLLYVAWLGLALYHAPNFKLWVVVPLVGFIVDRALGLRTRTRHAKVVRLEPMRSEVTRVEIEKPPGFTCEAGDYAFLNLPGLARHEWHPFTLSSAPEKDRLTMHVRSLGNFTRSLNELAVRRKKKGDLRELSARLDGPYGTPSGEIFESRFPVLIGAGIGVTPFASILESIVLRAEKGSPGPEKVHFYWLNRDAYSFEWFAELLLDLERVDTRGLVEVHIYMTDGKGHLTAAVLNLARAIAHDRGQPDLITGLRSKTNVGRPDWADELGRIVEAHAPEPVDVFFCGPPGLAHAIDKTCRELGARFRQEQF